MPAPVGPSTTRSSSRRASRSIPRNASVAPSRLRDAAQAQERRRRRVGSSRAASPSVLARRAARTLTAAPPSAPSKIEICAGSSRSRTSAPETATARDVASVAHDEPPAGGLDVDVARAAEVLLGHDPARDRAARVFVHVLAADPERRLARRHARRPLERHVEPHLPRLRHEQPAAVRARHLAADEVHPRAAHERRPRTDRRGDRRPPPACPTWRMRPPSMTTIRSARLIASS